MLHYIIVSKKKWDGGKARMQAINTVDGQLLLWIQGLRNPLLDKIVVLFTGLGDNGYLFIALALLLLIIPATRKTGFTAALGLALGSACTMFLLKPFFMRPRPYLTVPGLTALVDMSYDPNSFPSGHTTAAFGVCMAVFLTVEDKRAKIASITLAVLMGFSRLYVGVHNPTDVIAGALIGTMGAILAIKIVGFLDKKISEKKAHDPWKEKT